MLNNIEPFLLELCDAAARETMPRFRRRLSVENKLEEAEGNDFDPVTEADKAAEAAIRALITDRYPDHGILGEEEAPVNPDAEYCWHIDPVDGTRAFICGLPSWGTLIGLSQNGKAFAGVMQQPFTGEYFIATGDAAFHLMNGERTVLRTSGINDLSQAKMMTTTPLLFTGENRDRYLTLEKMVRLPRYGFDCYAYAMVAAGHIDLVVETELKSYDIAALIPVIEQAGGRVTTWDGGNAINGGSILASANPALHEAAMVVLAGN